MKGRPADDARNLHNLNYRIKNNRLWTPSTRLQLFFSFLFSQQTLPCVVPAKPSFEESAFEPRVKVARALSATAHRSRVRARNTWRLGAREGCFQSVYFTGGKNYLLSRCSRTLGFTRSALCGSLFRGGGGFHATQSQQAAAAAACA